MRRLVTFCIKTETVGWELSPVRACLETSFVTGFRPSSDAGSRRQIPSSDFAPDG